MRKKLQSNTEKILLDAGLSEKEIGVYAAILELGKGTVTQISGKAGINRTTGYDILESLAAKKLVTASGKEPKQEYVAENPDALARFVEGEIEKKKENLAEIKNAVGELKTIHNISARPKVMFYEGVDGLKEVFEDTLSAKTPIVAFANYETAHPILPNYFEKYYARRAKAGISARGIVLNTAMAKERKANNTEEIRGLALIPEKEFYFSPGIEIYDNKVMIASWAEKLGIIIESHEIAEAMKKIFELAWSEAKRLDEMAHALPINSAND